MNTDWFSQAGYRCRMEWGWRGAKTAVVRGDVLVVVDTLRFSTAATTCIQHGGLLYPCRTPAEVMETAARVGAEAGGYRGEGPTRYGLSPQDYLSLQPGTRIAIPSPNGATCCRFGTACPALFVGTLVNAAATARAVQTLLATSDLNVTILACGERWEEEALEEASDGRLRFAIEDYLGAGAILSGLSGAKSPEAQVCEGAFYGAAGQLADILWECSSGRELRDKGLGEDVKLAAHLNRYDAVPMLQDSCLVRFSR